MLPQLLILAVLVAALPAAAGSEGRPLIPEPSAEMRAAAARATRARKIDPAMLEAARGVFKDYSSPQARQARAAQTEALHALLGVEPESGVGGGQAPAAPPADRLYVFVSGSMPLSTLRHYARDIEGVAGAALVLRGCVGGCRGLAESAGFAARVLRRKAQCEGPRCAMRRTGLLIDPLLFRRYGIERVPAVVLAEGVDNPGQCSEGNEAETSVATWHIARGDAALTFVLESLLDAGVAGAGAYLQSIRGEHQ